MATTTNYSWTTPDNTAYVKDGASAIRTLGSSVDTTLYTALGGAYPGLRLIKKQTIGSAVSSVAVTGAFSATYENYRIIVSGGVQSADTNLRLVLGASTANYNGFLNWGGFTSASPQGAIDNAAAQFSYVGGGTTTFSHASFDLGGPFLAQPTQIYNAAYRVSSSAGLYNGIHNVSTSYTGFTISPASGTLTGGTIYVYGYGAS